jgi:hypothetical protein
VGESPGLDLSAIAMIRTLLVLRHILLFALYARVLRVFSVPSGYQFTLVISIGARTNPLPSSDCQLSTQIINIDNFLYYEIHEVKRKGIEGLRI